MQDTHLENMRAVGAATARSARADELQPMPAQPTLVDIFTRRMDKPKFGLPFAAGHHGAQCVLLAMKAGVDEETVLACLRQQHFAVLSTSWGTRKRATQPVIPSPTSTANASGVSPL